MGYCYRNYLPRWVFATAKCDLQDKALSPPFENISSIIKWKFQSVNILNRCLADNCECLNRQDIMPLRQCGPGVLAVSESPYLV